MVVHSGVPTNHRTTLHFNVDQLIIGHGRSDDLNGYCDGRGVQLLQPISEVALDGFGEQTKLSNGVHMCGGDSHVGGQCCGVVQLFGSSA